MNFKSIIIIFIFMLLPFSVMANEVSDDEVLQVQNTCGLTADGRIHPTDTTICRSDIAFSVLYESFQYFYDSYIFKALPLKEFSSEEYLEGADEGLGAKLRASSMMATMFKSIINVTFVFIFTVIMFNIVLGIFKSLEDGSFMGRDFNFKSQIVYYLLGVFLLIPIGDIFIIHLLIMIIAMVAIVPANFMFTYFIYFVSTLNAPLEAPIEPVRAEFDNSYYYAARAIDFHVNVDFCRRSTFNYIFTEGADRVGRDGQNYEECFLYNNNKFFTRNTDTLSANNPFLNYFSTNSGNLRYRRGNEAIEDVSLLIEKYNDSTSRDVFFFDELEYSKRIESPNCQEMRRGGEHFSVFSCGMVSIEIPTEKTHRVLYVDYDFFIRSITSLLSGLNINNFTSERIQQEYNIFKDAYINRANNIIDNDSYSNRERNVAKGLIQGADKELLESQLIEAWHLAIYNHINFGTKIMLREDSGMDSVLYEGFGIVDDIRNRSVSIAKRKYESHCLSDPYSMTNTYNFIKSNNDNNKNAFCFNYESRSIFGDEDGNINFPIEDEDGLANLADMSMKSMEVFEREYNELLDLISNMYHEIELSIFKSYKDMNVDSDSNMDVFISARQNGFLAFPQMLLFIEKRVDEWENIRNRVFDSTKYVLSTTNQMNVSANVYTQDLEKNGNAFTIDDTFTQSYITRSYDVHINSNDYIRDMTTYFVESGDGIFETVSKTIVRTLIGNDIDRILSTMGVRESFLDMEDTYMYTEYCTDHSTMGKCPIPQTNPLVAFNQLGIHFIERGGKMLAGVVGMNMVSSYMSSKVNVAGNVGDGTNVSGSAAPSVSSSSTDRAFGVVASMMSMIAGVIGVFALLLIFVGAGFAFSIPLIPLIYMTVNFVQWVIHLFNLLFVSNIFVGYLFNISESRNSVISFFKQNILHILLLPTFVIISMLFLWSFYYVVIFFINLTLFTVLETSNNLFSGNSVTEVVISLLNPFIMAAIILYVLYAITKFIFSYISSMYQKIFDEILNSNTDDGTESAAKMILSVFAIKQTFGRIQERIQRNNEQGIGKLKDKIDMKNKVNSDLSKIIDNNVNDFSFKGEDGVVRDYKNAEDFALAINNQPVLTRDGSEIAQRKSELIDFINSSIDKGKLNNVKGLDLNNMTYKGIDISDGKGLDHIDEMVRENQDILGDRDRVNDLMDIFNNNGSDFSLLKNIDGLDLENMTYNGNSIDQENAMRVFDELSEKQSDLFELSDQGDIDAYKMWLAEKNGGNPFSNAKDVFNNTRNGLRNIYSELAASGVFVQDQIRKLSNNKVVKKLDENLESEYITEDLNKGLLSMTEKMRKMSSHKTISDQQKERLIEVDSYISDILKKDKDLLDKNEKSKINPDIKKHMIEMKEIIKGVYNKDTTYRNYQAEYYKRIQKGKDLDSLRREKQRMELAGIDSSNVSRLIKNLK